MTSMRRLALSTTIALSLAAVACVNNNGAPQIRHLSAVVESISVHTASRFGNSDRALDRREEGPC